ncbi:MAG TPA: DUF4124 domain-containing protein [Steroidobacteraceae bacterium]|nr:DUF4124 domain-containing protein [Steroidobacteraceae bacterium]
MRTALHRYVVSRAASSGALVLALGLCALPAGLLIGAGVTLAADSGGADGSVTTYRWVDAQGVVHYSDTPQPGAQKVEIAPAQTFQSAPAPAGDGNGPPGPAPGAYADCAIVQPQSQQSFYAPDSVPVTVQLAPQLRPGDRVRVSVDGQPVTATDDSGTNFQVDSPYRGQHTLTATVVDPAGMTVCTAKPVIFYVQRPSLLLPHAPANGHGVAPIASGR